ncbi:hypothetical protein GQ597_05595 [Gilliamella sp. Pra-s65]|uniref:PAAR domain-containing protein n=1 Tax=unclassified Gilliamella TaxID=2685620 RepID=UPI001365D5DA|nr:MULTISPECIES: PAAR domain-containing protein [unclassified Gilliamella]MWN90173.1 hypothetical protein [Gilliamella sp. Pra-s65]MWP73144.1 hypothetical protein [Gilliamella sp. Pra-s52]
MSKRIAVLGDNTTTGGKIISASDQSFCQLKGVACIGDYAYCPKCENTGKIIEGTDNFIIAGKPAAYDGCIIACKCSPVGYNKIIATKSTIFVGAKNQNSHFVRMTNTSVKSDIYNNLTNKVEKNSQQDVEAYLFTTRMNNFTQLGTHSALYIHIKGKTPLIFDPNGDYMRQYRGQADAFYDDGDIPFSIEQFVKYHAQDGDYVSQREITLTRDQALNIEKRIINGNYEIPPYFPYCAYAIS